MAQQKDHRDDLDCHVQQLEAKVDKLRASLTHWRQWYMEYSVLKEEVEQLPKDPQPRKDLARIRRDFDSELLTKKEINEIFGKTDLKGVEQILSVLDRRLDYVEQNVHSLEKQLEAEGDRLSAAVIVAYPDGGTDEVTGLPLVGIIEQLDDDGNVVGSFVQSGADSELQVLETLKQAGIKNLPEAEAELPKDEPPSTDNRAGDLAGTTSSKSGMTASQQEQAESTEAPKSPSGRSKSVSFAEDTKPGHEPSDRSTSTTPQSLVELWRRAKEESENFDVSRAVIPDDESPEDSEMRRLMLDHMSELGPIVAELDVEEWDSQDDDDEEDGWSGADEIEDDDEDELGRTKRSVLTGDYVQRMQQLEKRLQSQGAFATTSADIGKATIISDPESKPRPSSFKGASTGEPKSVKFATTLDIAQEKAPEPVANVQQAKPAKPAVNPVSDIIVEKSATPVESVKEDAPPPKRASRFKKERGATPVTAPSLPPTPLQIRDKLPFVQSSAQEEPAEPAPPEGKTLAPSVVERTPSVTPKEPDEMDQVLLHQAASVEYHRRRNNIIQQQGGFLKQEETEIVPLEEDEGGPPRVSRFKAARLAKQL